MPIVFKSIAAFLCATCLAVSHAQALERNGITYEPISPHFIAALADPTANSGTGAETWGYWDYDPGKFGVWLRLFPVLKAAGGFAPGNWKFNIDDWWLDENGLLMPHPDYGMPPGNYLVTGDREVTTTLTVHEADENGVQRWELHEDAELFDVTHMPCRSARYTPIGAAGTCTPENVDRSLFKVAPGTEMPQVPLCEKQDYAVLIVVGIEAK